MIRSHTLFSRAVLTALVAAPLGIMAVLAIAILVPATKNPESKIYASGIGYPAMQRLANKPIAVQTVPVTQKSLEDNVAAPGESVALHQVEVRALVSGAIEKVYVEEGQRVRRGEPLFQIQQAPYQNAVASARSNVAISEVTLKALQQSAPEQLLALKDNVDKAKQRLALGKTKTQQIQSLVDAELQDNITHAQQRLAIASTKLKQIDSLAAEGAVSKFQLYDSQDNLISRQKELITAKRGAFDTQIRLYNNQDFLTNLENRLFSAQQKLSVTQSDLERQITNARLKLEQDKIALQDAQRNLNNTVVYATTDGLVSQVNIERGELAGARGQKSYMTLTQDIVFKAFVDQTRLNSISVGDRATVRLVAYPGRSYQGKVIRVNPTVETEAGSVGKVGISQKYTYSVWVAVAGLQLAPGLQGYVQFEQGKQGLFIPESAVTHLSGGEGMVMVAENGKAMVKRVKLGRIFDNQREVLTGLNDGEQVIPSPRALQPGDRLTVSSYQ
jgi:HlyD family secretion protein